MTRWTLDELVIAHRAPGETFTAARERVLAAVQQAERDGFLVGDGTTFGEHDRIAVAKQLQDPHAKRAWSEFCDLAGKDKDGPPNRWTLWWRRVRGLEVWPAADHDGPAVAWVGDDPQEQQETK